MMFDRVACSGHSNLNFRRRFFEKPKILGDNSSVCLSYLLALLNDP